MKGSFYCRLMEDKKSEKFFQVFNNRMKAAQLEIKATVSVNTSDLGNKRRDDQAPDKDTPQKKRGWRLTFFIPIVFVHILYTLEMIIMLTCCRAVTLMSVPTVV